MEKIALACFFSKRNFATKMQAQNFVAFAAAALGFFRGGWSDFQKNSKILMTFFWVDQNNFPSFPKALKKRCFGQIFCTAVQISEKKTGQKSNFWALFGIC